MSDWQRDGERRTPEGGWEPRDTTEVPRDRPHPERIRFRFEDPEMIDWPEGEDRSPLHERGEMTVRLAEDEMAAQGLRLPPESDDRPFGMMPRTPWSVSPVIAGCPPGKVRLVVEAMVEVIP